jgi:hypothetical protein
LLAACGGEEGEEGSDQSATTGTGAQFQSGPNSAPTIFGLPRASIPAGFTYHFEARGRDANGDRLSFGIEAKPEWLTFDTQLGVLTGRPGEGDVGTYSDIVIWVSDGRVNAQLPAFDIAVTSSGQFGNSAPSIEGEANRVIVVGENYDFIPTVFDPNGDLLTFSVFGLPAWAAFDAATGRISGAPQAGDVGFYDDISLAVNDGTETTVLDPFLIVVNPAESVNSAPTIFGTPATAVDEGIAYLFAPTASDSDGDTLTFTITNKPHWAGFDTATGRLSGTPNRLDAGKYDFIRIVVSDGTAISVLPVFSITVAAMNGPPVLSGSPLSEVVQGTEYVFRPAVNDPDGDPVNFSISGKPAWATFNSSTGELRGRPDASAVGSSSTVSITASDGFLSTTIGPFGVTVVSQGNGQATLSWLPPTENTDGSPLTDLAGYEIHWGINPGSYTESAVINNQGITSYVVDNLLSGATYYFATSAFTASGMQSNFSNEASKTIP